MPAGTWPARKTSMAHNALNRLDLLIDRSPTNTIINCWKYRSTGAGQRTWVEEFDKRTAWYTYDSLGRLKTETVTGSIQDGKNGTVTYGYDNVGNRLTRSSSLSGVTNQTLGYDPNDRLNGDQYDNNGNTKSAPVSQPSTINSQPLLGTDDYDSENRLTQRTGTNGSVVRLVYDGDGNRICEIVDGQIKSYLIDDRNPTGYAQVVEEIVNGVVNHTYTYGHDLISQDQMDPATGAWHASFYAYDGHGNVRFLTNETGAVTDTYVYDAFGTLITATGSTNNRYLYTGEPFDPNLGLDYLRARFMNPLTGRFWSADTYEGNNSDPVSLHKYLYGAIDPTNHIDPSGHDAMTLPGQTLIAGIIASAARSAVITIGILLMAYDTFDMIQEQTGIRAIETTVAAASSYGISQDEFDDLDARIARTKTSRRQPKLYLSYSFQTNALGLVGLGLRAPSWATRTAFPTGWEAKKRLGMYRGGPKRRGVHRLAAGTGVAIYGPNTVRGRWDTFTSPPIWLSGGADEYFFELGSGGPGTVFGPMPIPLGMP
jgi:RHS repeat-associated protein